MINTILFDLDGTLLPMDMQAFESHYGKTVASYVAGRGLDAGLFMKALLAGTEAMKTNDGNMTNAQRFERTFGALFAPYDEKMDVLIKAFFDTEHYVLREAIRIDPYADKLVKKAKALGYTVVLASNPYSPQPATHARMRAAGLDIEDFALITTMENSRYCKPSPGYFAEVLQKIKKRPEECLMVGNDVAEDMKAGDLGFQTYLVLPCMINKQNADIGVYQRGTLERLYRELPSAV